MRQRLKTFHQFVENLFPSEIAIISKNHSFKDVELIQLIDDLSKKSALGNDISFNASLDPRKYSKFIAKAKSLLLKFDVDEHFIRINRIHSSIITDIIPPDQERQIYREMDRFSVSDFHSLRFYEMIQSYEHHLLMRNRRADLVRVHQFIEKHKASIQEELERTRCLRKITISISNESFQSEENLNWLQEILYNNEVSQGTRYSAWLAYNMHYINKKSGENLVEPMKYLEGRIADGMFYSRRILSNFYANKLLIFRYIDNLEEANKAGKLSLKYETVDHLYYLNNYCSTLIQTNQGKTALAMLKKNENHFYTTRSASRKLIYLAHRMRCEKDRKEYPTLLGMCRDLIDTLKSKLFNHTWHYFFRQYLLILFRTEQYHRILRINRKYKLTSREESIHQDPYIKSIISTSAYLTLGLSEENYLKDLESWKSNHHKPSFKAHLLEISLFYSR